MKNTFLKHKLEHVISLFKIVFSDFFTFLASIQSIKPHLAGIIIFPNNYN